MYFRAFVLAVCLLGISTPLLLLEGVSWEFGFIFIGLAVLALTGLFTVVGTRAERRSSVPSRFTGDGRVIE
jgi:hypothetical protein